MNTLAKYIESLDKEKEVIIVKWNVLIYTVSEININIISGNTMQTYKVRVKSVSEVAAYYSINITNIPEGVSVALDDLDPVTAVNNEITFENVGILNVGDFEYHEHRLTFNADLSAEALETEVDIDVLFVQVEL
jgi:hypothetical protein